MASTSDPSQAQRDRVASWISREHTAQSVQPSNETSLFGSTDSTAQN